LLPRAGEPTLPARAGTNGATMPKMKTHKASRKRFRVTASGKLKRHQAGKKHLLSHKTGKRKRHLREDVVQDNKLSKKYVLIMGGKV
jgi:large subunit ribosomal protein L35